MTRLMLSIGTAATLVGASAASADVNRCASADTTVQYRDALFDEMSGDTGWFPSGSSAQLRLTGRLAGMTTVAMGLSPTACWDGAMRVTAPGRARTGVLDVAYGAQLQLFGQIHTSVLGYQIDWEGQIPLPTDFLLASTVTFDPALLRGSPVEHVTATDSTSPLTLLRTDVIGALIDITGISGGLYLDAVSTLATTYGSDGITVDKDTITAPAFPAEVDRPAGGFGAELPLAVGARGTLRYAPAITFNAGADIRILGVRVASWQLFAITMPLPQFETAIVLPGPEVRIPLPDAPILDDARVDFATGHTQRLALHNAGAAPLEIEAVELPVGVTALAIAIGPGEDGALVLELADGIALAGAARFATNDPDQPEVSIQLGRDIGGTGVGDEPGEASGCAAGSKPSGCALVVVGLALLRRRRVRA